MGNSLLENEEGEVSKRFFLGGQTLEASLGLEIKGEKEKRDQDGDRGS